MPLSDDIDLQISVIIPVYNGETYILQAIDSILQQHYPIREIIIMDDGSTDQTAGLVSTYHPAIRYYKKDHTGIADTLNQGISNATGDTICFLDADDLWSADKLTKQTALLSQNEADIVFGHVKQFISPDLSAGDQAKLVAPEKPAVGYLSGTMLARKQTIETVGKFSTSFKIGEFIDWYLRAVNLNLAIKVLPDTILYRRLHKTNTTRQANKLRQEYLYVVKAALDRKRKQP